MGYISSPSILNAIIGITSYYCVILKTVILHDGIKTMQNVFFRFPKNKNNILFLLKKTKTGFQKTKKKQVGCFFWKKKRIFLNPSSQQLPRVLLTPQPHAMRAAKRHKHTTLFVVNLWGIFWWVHQNLSCHQSTYVNDKNILIELTS